MEVFAKYKDNNNSYCKSIRDSIYIEGSEPIVKVEKGVNDICEVIIGNHNIEYSVLDSSQKQPFILTKKLNIVEFPCGI